uniref:Uncharacterized protein n=1 Tax=Anopheles culicifacies TaxID=139723 RepID=A0A182LWR0_9DIPT
MQISKIELFNRFARTYCRAIAASNTRDALHNLVPSTVPEGSESSGVTYPGAIVQPGDSELPVTEGIPNIAKLSYKDAKALAVEYTNQWDVVRESMFGKWTEKPDSLGRFFIEGD